MDREKREQRTALPWRPESGLVFTPQPRKSASHFGGGGGDGSGVQTKETQIVGIDSVNKTEEEKEWRRWLKRGRQQGSVDRTEQRK
jgi:hypothetical protein